MEDNKKKGFVKLYRGILEWEWYSEPNTTHLFIYCVLKANYQGKKWKGKVLDRGDFITSIEHISRDTGLSISKVRTSLERLTKSGCIRKKSTNKYTAIRVVNYKDYQEIPETIDNRFNLEEQSLNNEIATTKEIKKEKEVLIKKEERGNSLSNFDQLYKRYNEQMDTVLKRHVLPDKQKEFCIAKFNEKDFKFLGVKLFENFLENWIKNLERDGTMEDWRRSRMMKTFRG
ncbi:hypothetical protein [Flagellimonas sp.]|uniref:hypothetical protein n=1 Tax=Flagellimonas sp. TaxID=2058762 RepID=UPI003BB0DB88